MWRSTFVLTKWVTLFVLKGIVGISIHLSFQIRDLFRKWCCSNATLNVTIVEQKQKEASTFSKDQLQYDFILDDYNKYIDLCAMDMPRFLHSETGFRLLGLHRLKYGNRTEIEAALVSSPIGETILLQLSYRNLIVNNIFILSVLSVWTCACFCNTDILRLLKTCGVQK